MTTVTIQIPDTETATIAAISALVNKVKGSHINIESEDDGFTVEELAGLKRSLKEAAMIKKGELTPLSMNDLWDE